MSEDYQPGQLEDRFVLPTETTSCWGRRRWGCDSLIRLEAAELRLAANHEAENSTSTSLGTLCPNIYAMSGLVVNAIESYPFMIQPTVSVWVFYSFNRKERTETYLPLTRSLWSGECFLDLLDRRAYLLLQSIGCDFICTGCLDLYWFNGNRPHQRLTFRIWPFPLTIGI